MLTDTMAEIDALSQGIDPEIRLYGRIKSIRSVLHKMSVNGLGARQVLDIIGIRAITRSTGDCYRLASQVHHGFEILAPEFDDYIAAPKPNGYRSIHTTVISPSGLPVEIQIRTLWMHALCEHGPAAHARYKRTQAAWMPLSRPRGNGAPLR